MGVLMDCRPVVMGHSLRNAVTKALLQPFLQDIIAETKPTQFGCGEKAGGSQMIFLIQLILEACPEFVCLALDLVNAYNEVSREDCLEEIWKRRRLKPLWYYLWRTKCISAYVGLGSSERMITAGFMSDEGEQQGSVESSVSFCITVDPVNRATNDDLGVNGGFLLAGIDDTYLLGLPEHVFPTAMVHKTRLSTIGLTLNLSKTKCYIAEEYRTLRFHDLRGEIAEGFNIDATTGVRSRGFCAYGVPIGEDSFIATFLSNKGDKTSSDIRLVGERMNPQVITSPELPSRQCLWQLILRCLQFKGNYWLVQACPWQIHRQFCKTN